MIVNANAIVQPGAVVVEALDATIADGAVARARRTQHLAVWAHLTRVDLLEEFQEVVLWAKITRVAGRGDEEA